MWVNIPPDERHEFNWQVMSAVINVNLVFFSAAQELVGWAVMFLPLFLHFGERQREDNWQILELPSWLSHSRSPAASHKFRSHSHKTTKGTFVVPWQTMEKLKIPATAVGLCRLTFQDGEGKKMGLQMFIALIWLLINPQIFLLDYSIACIKLLVNLQITISNYELFCL